MTLATFCERLPAGSGVTSDPAVNVELLALRLGVAVRERTRLSGGLGRVHVSGNEVQVHLRAGLPSGTRRFVLAHELGHVVCADPRLGTFALRRRLDLDEERFCDRFAEELLLPKHWLVSDFARQQPNLDALFSCAEVAQVSRAAAAVALFRGAGWHRTFLRLVCEDSRWRILSVTGHLPISPASLRTTKGLGRILDQAVESDGRVDHVTLPLAIGRETWHVSGACHASGRHAFVLADLDFESHRGPSGSVKIR